MTSAMNASRSSATGAARNSRRRFVGSVLAGNPARCSRICCTVTRFRYPKGKDGTEVVLYKIDGGGHTWPNGMRYLSEKLIGKVARPKGSAYGSSGTSPVTG